MPVLLEMDQARRHENAMPETSPTEGRAMWDDFLLLTESRRNRRFLALYAAGWLVLLYFLFFSG